MGLTSALPNAIIQPGVCTSTTRPTSPYKGQTIYETNTGSLLVYYGTTTGWRPPWNQPWGFVAMTTSQSNSFNGLGHLVGVDTSFTAIANRMYRINGHASLEVQTGRAIINLVSSVAGVLFRISDFTAAATVSYPHADGSYIGTLAAGSTTISIQVVTISGTTNGLADSVYNQHRIYIEDIGPATSTAPTS